MIFSKKGRIQNFDFKFGRLKRGGCFFIGWLVFFVIFSITCLSHQVCIQVSEKYGHAAHFTLNFYYCLFIMLLFDFIEAVIKYEKFVFFRRGATRKISFEEGEQVLRVWGSKKFIQRSDCLKWDGVTFRVGWTCLQRNH